MAVDPKKITEEMDWSSYRTLPLVQLQAVVRDLAAAVEEMRHQLEELRDEVAELQRMRKG